MRDPNYSALADTERSNYWSIFSGGSYFISVQKIQYPWHYLLPSIVSEDCGIVFNHMKQICKTYDY